MYDIWLWAEADCSLDRCRKQRIRNSQRPASPGHKTPILWLPFRLTWPRTKPELHWLRHRPRQGPQGTTIARPV